MAPSYDKTIATAASLAASLMLVRSLANELLPSEVRDALSSALASLRSRMTWQHTIVIEETEGWSGNRVYGAVKAYLATRTSANLAMQRLRVSSADEEGPDSKMVVSMEAGEEMSDVYEGTEFRWCLVTREVKGDPNGNGGAREVRSYELSFHKRHKEKALKEYLPFIVATAKAIKDQDRSLNIYMNEYGDEWNPIDLQHPSTFDTLAMDMKEKKAIVDDLDRFIKRKDYYRRIGKAWKRGYLLYGPPGTGKSSLIAAIANHLRFDIYDLELTGVDSNSDLRRLLVGMTNRSILVVEDIDCTIELKQREETDQEHATTSNPTQKKKAEDKVTLSGLLNFVDGLWSTSGEERIIIFTTNYKERLDPALLRPGRMDMHIHMGYCTTEAFRILANNYHSIDYHVAYPEIEALIEEVTVTPAEVAEVLMRSDDTDAALHDLVKLLKLKKIDATKIETESKQAEEKKDTNETKTQSMQVDEKKVVAEIKTECVQVEGKKNDKKVVVKNDFTENGSG
ncbi:AAA-ATPase At3g50940-like isoform X1 [Hordeum vulgare subsp. vulgare]|uniref:AAA-ATPase At3g50940-like isoform X1 n=1 Tax=Hordeum vulgare subsp. vulgare TaxID=112509 RepID=UPI001D1A492B|nr:AAA-ATPase At3g50940-like isoform X1 [Hordeum vulgare subsp. vulgare]